MELIKCWLRVDSISDWEMKERLRLRFRSRGRILLEVFYLTLALALEKIGSG